MAEEQDQSQKTEEPTQRRLDEAHRKGQVASSREVNHVFIFGAALLVVGALGGGVSTRIGEIILPYMAAPHEIPLDPGGLLAALSATAAAIGGALALPAALFVAAALAAGLVQNGPMSSLEPLAPKLERISPVAGAKRLFSLRALMEFLKGVLKITLVGAAAAAILWPWQTSILASNRLDPAQIPDLLTDLVLRLLGGITALVTVLALLDVAYQRFEHRKKLRMSRRDLQDEAKQSEGDPQIKARLRSLRMERARRRMMAAVPDSTVVITNPTHYAVALAYDQERMAAPRVVAKGADELALRIRRTAEEHRVPVIRHPPLARVLHATVDLDGEVPPAHYQAVAEIIGRVMRLRGGAPAG